MGALPSKDIHQQARGVTWLSGKPGFGFFATPIFWSKSSDMDGSQLQITRGNQQQLSWPCRSYGGVEGCDLSSEQEKNREKGAGGYRMARKNDKSMGRFGCQIPASKHGS